MPWDLTGNSGTNPETDFLGTRDNQPLVIRTNGAEALRIDGSGSVVIGGSTGIDSSVSVLEFGQGESTPLLLRRDEAPEPATGGSQNVLFILDPTNRVFNLDVSGTNNSQARIHLGDPERADNPVTTHGSVGIGTTQPAAKLAVNGDVEVTGDIRLLGADCAENFDVSEAEAAEPGTVMVIDQEGTLKPSEQPYDKRVAGVVSGAGGLKPGIVLDKQESNEGRLPVALVGKVVCNVDARHSPIEVGDLLTTSSTPGHAMKADDPLRAFGAVIGKALHSLKGGQGIIPVLIALQ
jgi:hypothetical protein